MSVELRPVTQDNFSNCCNLHTSSEEEANYEAFRHSVRFVDPNIASLAFVAVSPVSVPLAIYANNQMVGFLQYAPLASENNDGYEIYRLMVDYRHAGNRYGRTGMELTIEALKALPDCKRIRTSVEPENVLAERLYRSLGFVPTGQMDGNEVVMELQTV